MIFFVSFAVYFNSLFNGFVFDDEFQVMGNKWITDFNYIPDIFSHHVWSFVEGHGDTNYYRPMMFLFYMLDYHVFGLKPWGYHLLNVLFHASVSVLVFIITLRLLDQFGVTAPRSYRGAVAAGLLFAVNPIHTEAVAWVAGLPDVSFTFFCLLSFYFFIKAISGEPHPNTSYFVSLLSFFVAALCKEPALTLPIILAAYDYALTRAEANHHMALKKYIPYLIVVALYLLLRFQALGGLAPAKTGIELSGYQYFINVFPLFVQYLKKLILPVDLNVFYVFHPITSLFETKGIISLFLTILFVVLIFISLKKNRIVFLSLLVIAVPLLPALYIPALGKYAFAERYLYLPSFGVVLIAADLVGWAEMKKTSVLNGVSALCLIVAGLYAWGTIERNTTWKDNVALYTDAIKKSPDADTPYYNLGRTYESGREFAKAIEMYRKAIDVNPANFEAYNNLADVYLVTGEYGRAEILFDSAISLRPNSDKIYNNRGRLYLTMKQYGRAIRDFTRAIDINPNIARYYVYRGRAYSLQGRFDSAISDFTSAIALNADNPETYAFRGLAYSYAGDPASAEKDLRRSCNMGYKNACDVLRRSIQ